MRQQHEEKKRTEIRIITNKKSEHEVLARITYLESANGNRKEMEFEVAKGTQHSWHKLVGFCERACARGFVTMQRSNKKR